MGLLDVPASTFRHFDVFLGTFLAPLPRLAVWSLLAALVSMFLYRVISPQRRIAVAAAASAEARRRIIQHDGNFDELWTEIRHFLASSTLHICLTLGPATLASLPLAALLAWLSTDYDRTLPAGGARIKLWVRPAHEVISWQPPDAATGGNPWTVRWPAPDNHVDLQDGSAMPVAVLPLAAPVPQIHKRHWWNLILGNPAGYLPDSSPLDEIVLDLPRRTFHKFGPAWTRTWELPFFSLLVLFSLVIKFVFRIN